MTNADGWIKHDGGNNPVTPDSWVQLQSETQAPMRAEFATWSVIPRYRIFAPVTPSPFVRETAARIMAAIAVHGGSYPTDEKLAEAANRGIRAALALEAALKEIEK